MIYREEMPKGELGFMQSRIEASDEANVVRLDGVCPNSHEGGKLQWSLLSSDVKDSALVSGETECHSGAFHLLVNLREDMVCGLGHLAAITTDWGGTAYAQIIKRCQPLASERLPGQCALEFNVKTGNTNGRICERVCYSGNRVSRTEVLPTNQCQSLAATLAGP